MSFPGRPTSTPTDARVGVPHESVRDELYRQTLAKFEAAFAAKAPGTQAVEIHRGGQDATGKNLSREVVEVGEPGKAALQLVHSLWPLGDTLEEGRRAVSSPNDLTSGDSLTVLDHFLQEEWSKKGGGSTLLEVALHPTHPQKEVADRQLNSWQIIYADVTDPDHPTLGFQAVTPQPKAVPEAYSSIAYAEADPTAVPTYNDMLAAYQKIEAAAAEQGRRLEFDRPLECF